MSASALSTNPAPLTFGKTGVTASVAVAFSDGLLPWLRIANCSTSAQVDEYAGYVPRTPFDNTPYRFNMDAGKKFTAAEFEAWMKRRGVRIARGRAPAAATTAAATATTTPLIANGIGAAAVSGAAVAMPAE